MIAAGKMMWVRIRNFFDAYTLSLVVYLLVAGVSALVEWSTFFVLAKTLSVFPAAIIAFFSATLTSYVLSRGVAFTSKRSGWEEIGLFFALSAFVFLFNLGSFTVMYAVLGVHPMIAKILGTGVGFVMNYVFRQFVIFARASRFAAISVLLGRRDRHPLTAETGGALEVTAPMTSAKITNPDVAGGYAGHRILEVMHSAPRYADAVYAHARAAYPSAEGPILDFGAGDGAFVKRFLRDGTAVDCVEPDTANQSALRVLVPVVAPDIGTLEADHYAFVYTINVLEHLRELDHYLAELYRVLRQGGRLFVFVPAFDVLWTSLDDEVEHVQRFTRQSLTADLENARFAIETSRYFDSAGFFAALTVRLLEKIGLFRYSSGTVGFYDRAVLPVSLFGDCILSRVVGKNVFAVARKL
jgi:putative flippase GtrA/SAM-dependent methyltransferase